MDVSNSPKPHLGPGGRSTGEGTTRLLVEDKRSNNNIRRPFSAGGNGVVVSGVCAGLCPPTLLVCTVRASGVAESEKSTKARARHARFPCLRLRRERDRSVCSTSKAKLMALARAATTTTTTSQHHRGNGLSGFGSGRESRLAVLNTRPVIVPHRATRSSGIGGVETMPLLRLSFFRDNGSASSASYWTAGSQKDATKTLRRAAPRQQ